MRFSRCLKRCCLSPKTLRRQDKNAPASVQEKSLWVTAATPAKAHHANLSCKSMWPFSKRSRLFSKTKARPHIMFFSERLFVCCWLSFSVCIREITWPCGAADTVQHPSFKILCQPSPLDFQAHEKNQLQAKTRLLPVYQHTDNKFVLWSTEHFISVMKIVDTSRNIALGGKEKSQSCSVQSV